MIKTDEKTAPNVPVCHVCSGADRVRRIEPRRGWGAAGQSYWPPQYWCMKCCKQSNGAYRLALR